MIIKRNPIAFALSALLITTLGSSMLVASENKTNEKKKTEKKVKQKKSPTLKTKDSKKKYKRGTSENPGKCGL